MFAVLWKMIKILFDGHFFKTWWELTRTFFFG